MSTLEAYALRQRVRELAAYDILRYRLRAPRVVQAPAAGIDWSLTVPPGEVWALDSVVATFVASAAVANRLSRLVASDAGTVWFRSPLLVPMTASNTAHVSWFDGAGAAVQNNTEFLAPLPPGGLVAPSGTVIGVSTLALDAADQWSQLAVRVAVWTVGATYWVADELTLQYGNEEPSPLTGRDAYAGTLPDQPAPPAASQ